MRSGGGGTRARLALGRVGMAVRSVVGVLLLAEGCLGDLYLHVSPGLPLIAV